MERIAWQGMRLHRYTARELKAVRKRVGLNQGEFWQRFGITQSGGSRYEGGRNIPTPIQFLLNLSLRPQAESSDVFNHLRVAKTETDQTIIALAMIKEHK